MFVYLSIRLLFQISYGLKSRTHSKSVLSKSLLICDTVGEPGRHSWLVVLCFEVVDHSLFYNVKSDDGGEAEVAECALCVS